MPYIKHLLDSFNEIVVTSLITLDNIGEYDSYKQKLDRERENYYSAKALHMFCISNPFLKEEGVFEEFQLETYHGIIDVHDKKHSYKSEKIQEVLIQVTNMSYNKSLLAQTPRVVCNKVKKGVCHMLVNNGVIDWGDRAR